MKDTYIKARNSKSYEGLYEYFLEEGGSNIGIQQFVNLFSFQNLNEILHNLDKKHNLTILEDSKGEFVKVVV